jgi:hypothetical protein
VADGSKTASEYVVGKPVAEVPAARRNSRRKSKYDPLFELAESTPGQWIPVEAGEADKAVNMAQTLRGRFGDKGLVVKQRGTMVYLGVGVTN